MFSGGRIPAALITCAFIALMFMPARFFFPVAGAGAVILGFVLLDTHATGGAIIIGTGVVMIGIGIWINIRGDADENSEL